jgi:hypothetical protein
MQLRLWTFGTIAFSLIAIASPPSGLAQEVAKAPTRADLEAFVKSWSDARFWILTDSRRIGWQRYQVRWGEFAGEKMLEVDFERATYLFTCERFKAWLRPDATLSPRAVCSGKTSLTLGVDKGTIGPPGRLAQKDPGNLSIFPLLLASFIPLKENAEVSFNYLYPRFATKPFPGRMKVLAFESVPGAAKPGSAWKIESSTTAQYYDDPETWETTLWLNSDRTLVRAWTKISYTLSFSGEKRLVSEELVPVEAGEWQDASLASNEVRAHAGLCLLADMNGLLRAHDADGNFLNDYWTGDVSGLCRIIPPKSKEPISLIPKEMAIADSAPLPAGPEKGGATMDALLGPKPAPWHGYFFKVLSKDCYEGEVIPLNEGTNHHSSTFGICAYPSEYGKTGRKTYFITGLMQSFWKDLKGQPIEEVPADLGKEGWQWDGPRR